MKQIRQLILPLALLLFVSFTSFSQSSQARKFPSPTSADTIKNPVKGKPETLADGKKTYVRFCVTCHGEKGKGDGLAAASLNKPPADHTSAFVQKQSDGAIFWIIAQGNAPMPKYKRVLTDAQTWAVVNYIRTLAKTVKK
jgi:mono/diheme cytochrome c family protein